MGLCDTLPPPTADAKLVQIARARAIEVSIVNRSVLTSNIRGTRREFFGNIISRIIINHRQNRAFVFTLIDNNSVLQGVCPALPI
jgi:hypothetical protein